MCSGGACRGGDRHYRASRPNGKPGNEEGETEMEDAPWCVPTSERKLYIEAKYNDEPPEYHIAPGIAARDHHKQHHYVRPDCDRPHGASHAGGGDSSGIGTHGTVFSPF